MIPLDLISARYDNPLLSATQTSLSSGFTRLADNIADQYNSTFSGTPLAGLYTDQGTLASAFTSPSGQQSRSPFASGFQLQSALAAYGAKLPSTSASSPASLATSIIQSAAAAPLSLYGGSQPSLAQSLDLFA